MRVNSSEEKAGFESIAICSPAECRIDTKTARIPSKRNGLETKSKRERTTVPEHSHVEGSNGVQAVNILAIPPT